MHFKHHSQLKPDTDLVIRVAKQAVIDVTEHFPKECLA